MRKRSPGPARVSTDDARSFLEAFDTLDPAVASNSDFDSLSRHRAKIFTSVFPLGILCPASHLSYVRRDAPNSLAMPAWVSPSLLRRALRAAEIRSDSFTGLRGMCHL